MAGYDLYSRGDRAFGAVNATLLGLFLLSIAYPFVFLVSLSLSSGFMATTGKVVLLPREPTTAAFEFVLSDRRFWISYANTIFYTVFGTLTSLLFIVPGTYALSRKRLRGRRLFNIAIAFTMWFHAGLIPFFLNVRDLGLLDSRVGILLGFACNAFNVILLRNYFESIPASFEEAAKMDGANEFQLLWKVFLPLSKPALATITLLCVVSRWNGYFWSMVLLRSESKIPLQVFLKKTIVDFSFEAEFTNALATSEYSVETIAAAIMVASIIPVALVYPYLQKHLAKGILLGGLKE